MTNSNGKERFLPSREIAYRYTAAMCFAQQLELDLRAILHTSIYHDWGVEIELDENQLKRFETAEGFIDEATLGSLIEKLEKTAIVKPLEAFKTLKNACPHRNELAHRFLAQQNFGVMTKKDEAKIIDRLREMSIELYQALRITGSLRAQAERLSDEEHKKMLDIFGEFVGADYDDPDRRYSARKQKKKG